MCEKYNGWTNYETWNVKFWMDNDEGEYPYWQERAEENRDEVYDLSQELKEYYQDNMPKLAGTYADLLGAALDSVNWYEIAENLLSDLEPEEEEEETEE
jgi:hypothetical protein